jgi:tRNA 2-(methylsulfanyl)-N6-isopentenyladenosine37 hydroxylase
LTKNFSQEVFFCNFVKYLCKLALHFNLKLVLHLKLPTDPRWVNIAEKNIGDILSDHAYCEQKAASACISLIVEHPNLDELVERLTPVVAEEWSHFERVLDEMKKRGFKLGIPHKDDYVVALQKHSKKGGSPKDRLLDKLLINALIEARSCERFKLLWQHIGDKELSKFYYELMVSEAGHYVNFIELARLYFAPAVVDKRWEEWLTLEAQIMENLALRGDRIH